MITFRTRIFLLLVAFSPPCLAPTSALAEWPHDPGDGNVPVCTAANGQVLPTIVADGLGGVIIAWSDYRSGTDDDIYVQRIDAAGVPQWTHDGVALCTAGGDQLNPTIVSDGAGGAIVAWMDNRNGSDPDIYAQRVDASGLPKWTADGAAICTTVGKKSYSSAVSDGAGGAVVTWQDHRSGTTDIIYAQRINAEGVTQWTLDGVQLATNLGNQQTPAILAGCDGGAIVTWMDFRPGDDVDLYAQRVDGAGIPQWTAGGLAVCWAWGGLDSPVLASDGACGAIIAWCDDRKGSDTDIYAQRVSASGAPQWIVNGVALYSGWGSQSFPAIVSDGAGGAIVAWEDECCFFDHEPGTFAQRVDSAGVPMWTANGVALSHVSYEGPYTIVTDGTGGAIITWLNFKGNYQIMAQRVSSAGGLPWGASGVMLGSPGNALKTPVAASNGGGGAIVTWQDYRSGTNYDIYAQNINADGTLGGSLLSAPSASIEARFALHGVQPNPSYGDVLVSFSLQDGTPALLELYDLTGRRIGSQAVGGLGSGEHVASLASRVAPLAPGVYYVRLTQGAHRASGKVAVLR